MDYRSYCTEQPFNHIPNYDNNTMLERIRSNDIILLELAHASDFYFNDVKDMIEALAENTSVRNVEMQEEFFGCLRKVEREALLEAISHIPNLSHVTLADSCCLMGSMTSLLKNARRLSSFHIRSIVMQGMQKDFDEFEKWLHVHPHLKSFDMKECVAANKDVNMESLVKASRSMAYTAPLPGSFQVVYETNGDAPLPGSIQVVYKRSGSAVSAIAA